MRFDTSVFLSCSAVLWCVSASANGQETDRAALFGALESIHDVSLSPDGNQLAFIDNVGDRNRRLFVVGTQPGATPRVILTSSGENGDLDWCGWVTNARLACRASVREKVLGDIMFATTMLAVDATGGNVRILSKGRNARSLYLDLRGGSILDWSSTDGTVLMTRSYVPESRTGTNLASSAEGLGVDRVDTMKGTGRRVEAPNRDAIHFFSDGRGRVRIMATQSVSSTGQLSPTIRYFYRASDGKGGWQNLSQYDVVTEQGYRPVAVDGNADRVIGFQTVDGRKAAVAMALDGTGATSVAYSHPVVDVDQIMRIGRTGRIVGVSYATDRREAVVTDEAIGKMVSALSKALDGKKIWVADASADESRYLIWASSDVDPGQYYLYSPGERELRPLLSIRDPLSDITLSSVRAITYPAADGMNIPGYLTLPPGRADARGLPAVVMPHGGPSARDEWGFDWMAQYFAQSGYAVLQPNFRGSSGYGDSWYMNNGFQSWKTALGDVADGGRWLVSAQGVDPAKLSIVGWSYGGYAALQTGVLAPDLFRAIVAIAPVTDLAQLKEEEVASGGRLISARFLGTGAHIREGSPAQNAAAIKAPVLMFHGSFDQNVYIAQSRTMKRALESKGKRVELIEYPELAHSLEAGSARTDMLRRISAFLPR